MTLLRVENLGKSYGGVAALRGVSFAVGPGEILGLMGANGAGKTTAFSLIAGTQRPSDGEIWFDGRRVDGKPPMRRRGWVSPAPFRSCALLRDCG